MSGIEYGVPGLPASQDALWVGPRLQHPSGIWWSPFGQANSSVTPVVGEYYSFPFYLYEDCTLNGIGIMIGSAAPSTDTVLKLGLHAHDVKAWLPRALIYASPEITGAPMPANTPQVVNGISIPLRRGLYWSGYMVTAGTTPGGCIHQAPTPASVGSALNFPSLKIYGSGAAPGPAAGNDGAIARQQGLSDIPGLFAGTFMNDNNNPKKAACMFFLTSSGSPR